MPLPVGYPTTLWTNQHIVLYHGTVADFASAIETRKTEIQVKMGKPENDFGQGFYLTTFRHQAEKWAAKKAAEKLLDPELEAVLQITVSREELAALETLVFVRGEPDANDYWSFVHHCWDGPPHHGRPGPQKLYDVVYGPVARFSPLKITHSGYDQVSFHTPAAEKVLNTSTIQRIK
jgi:hypothetical protein